MWTILVYDPLWEEKPDLEYIDTLHVIPNVFAFDIFYFLCVTVCILNNERVWDFAFRVLF